MKIQRVLRKKSSSKIQTAEGSLHQFLCYFSGVENIPSANEPCKPGFPQFAPATKKKNILVPDLGKHPGHLRLLGSLFKQNQHLLPSQGTKQWGTGNTFRTGAVRVQSCGGQKVPWHKHCQAQPAGKHLPDHQMYTVLTKKFKYSSLSKATAQN